MASLLSSFTPAQLALMAARAEKTLRQALSTTGVIVAGDDFAEVYLDDDNALFATNEVRSEDIVEVISGTSPNGYYTVSDNYYDPKVDAEEDEPAEDRLTLDGFPLAGGPISYQIWAPTPILADLATLDENRSRIENVIDPAVLALDNLFTVFHNQFNAVCDGVADTYRWLKGQDRSRVTATVINNSAAATLPTVLFPLGYYELAPNRIIDFGPGYPPIDPFTVAAIDSEQEGKNDEVSANPPSPGPGLDTPYTDALSKQDSALDNQDVALAALETLLQENDTVPESGNLASYYYAALVIVQAQRASIVLRKSDIADMLSQDRPRPGASGLNFGSFSDLQDEIDIREGQLLGSPFSSFLNYRFYYLDLLVNRAFGTRSELVSNTQLLLSEASRRATLIGDLTVERLLLEIV